MCVCVCVCVCGLGGFLYYKYICIYKSNKVLAAHLHVVEEAAEALHVEEGDDAQ